MKIFACSFSCSKYAIVARTLSVMFSVTLGIYVFFWIYGSRLVSTAAAASGFMLMFFFVCSLFRIETEHTFTMAGWI